MVRTVIAFALLVLTAASAEAEQRTFYGGDGKVVARSVTGSNGAVTHYDANGKVIGREATTRSGTTVYDAAGRKAGSSPAPSPHR